MNPARYFHTLRHLRPVQITGRLWHRVNPVKPDLRAAPSPSLVAGQWATAVERPASMLAADAFRFLAVIGQVRNAVDWNHPAREKLWLYNLHYFDDLNGVAAAERTAWHRALLARWVAENPPGVGNGWEPYPSSLRIVNWIKWWLAGNVLEPAWVDSLAVQARWLRRHIEWHLLGNHLFVNAKALVFAGLCFAGDEAAEWLARGLRILAREVSEQVLPDGGHFELSPMYHAIILEDVLDLLNAAHVWPGQVPDAVVTHWREVAGRMLYWLQQMIHPDGAISFFNDAALGIAANFAALAAYSERLRIVPSVMATKGRCVHLADSGYVRLQQGNAAALLDVARIGPDYLPGHAHADTLSFELSLFGQRVVVNSGTSQYGLGAERLRQRGTAAHSTVEVDGSDSSEVWGGFRVARRARPFGLVITDEDQGLQVICAHDGYRRLTGKPIHHRRWWLAEHTLQVSDYIEGEFRVAVAHYYLHPAVQVTGQGQAGQFILSAGQIVNWSIAGGIARVVPATWHPEFGVAVPSQCVEIQFEGAEAAMDFSWK